MHEPLNNIPSLGKKLFLIFWGADFLAPKSGHRCEKQPVLGPGGLRNFFFVLQDLIDKINSYFQRIAFQRNLFLIDF